MQAPNTRELQTHFVLIVKRRHLDCLPLGWCPAVLQQEKGCGEGKVLVKDSYSFSWLLDIKAADFSCTAVTKTGYSDKDSRLHVACITPRTNETATGAEKWKSLVY